MIRVIEHCIKITIAALIAILCFSCDFIKKVDGSGNVVTKNRTVSGEFTSVSAASGLDVVIEYGTERSVTVEADDNLHQHIMTDVSGGTLEISSDVNIRNAASKKVIIRMPVITGLEASSGAMVRSSSPIKSESIDLEVNSGSNMEVSIESKKVTCDASSGSHLKVSGSTDNLQTDASSGATLDARNLTAANVKSEVSSGSTTFVNPSDMLKAEASGGGTIIYTKTPDKLEQNISTGGSVSQQ